MFDMFFDTFKAYPVPLNIQRVCGSRNCLDIPSTPAKRENNEIAITFLCFVFRDNQRLQSQRRPTMYHIFLSLNPRTIVMRSSRTYILSSNT